MNQDPPRKNVFLVKSLKEHLKCLFTNSFSVNFKEIGFCNLFCHLPINELFLTILRIFGLLIYVAVDVNKVKDIEKATSSEFKEALMKHRATISDLLSGLRRFME